MHAHRTPRRGAAVAAVLLPLAGCAAPQAAPAPQPVFDPVAFFAGETVGEGRLKIAFRRAVAVHVAGRGSVERDGGLRLVQIVTEGSGPPSRREWRIRAVGNGSYAGTLTDARGPVAVAVAGNRLLIRFTMAHGLRTEQRLYLQPGGQVARNHLTVRKFGVLVAVLDERIERRPRS